jgi:cytochrome c553
MRRNSLQGLLWVVTLAGSMAHADTQAAAERSAATIAQQGDTHGTPACAGCHGPGGEGLAAAGYPRLAGLPAPYLLSQLNALADGTRQNPIMGPLARSMPAQERSQLSAYYASLPPRAAAAPHATKSLDDRLALHGRWSDEIPACIQCHGAGGSGVGATFPALAGQSSLYIASQLRAWKQGTRRGEPLGLMQAIAARLSESDISAVSDYFAAQPLPKPGARP